jgi:DNA repair exonuclease SbcCD ATPase subunit
VEEVKRKNIERERKLHEEEADWSARNEGLRKRVDEVDARVDEIWRDVKKTESAIVRLEESIQATNKAIQDKNERNEKNALVTIGKIAACAAASYVTGLAISESSGGGGVMIGKTWPIN